MSNKTQRSKGVKDKQKKTSKLPLILSLSVLAALVALYFLSPGFHEAIQEAYEVLTSEDEERIREWVSQFGAWGPLVILVVDFLRLFESQICGVQILLQGSRMFSGKMWEKVCQVRFTLTIATTKCQDDQIKGQNDSFDRHKIDQNSGKICRIIL